MMQLQIIDNFLPKVVADNIQELLLSNEFPWFFTPDITYTNQNELKEKSVPAFSHRFFHIDHGMSHFFNEVNSLPFIGSMRIPPSKITRAVAFLQMASGASKPDVHNNKHIDEANPHIVLLYYVVDSDGDTFIFSKDVNDGTVAQRVTPKKNRALVFDGSIYHASSRPTTNTRCVINFNLTPFDGLLDLR